jgi:hypothetical protein
MASARKTTRPAIVVRLPRAARFSKVTTRPTADERLAAAGRQVKGDLDAAARKAKDKA